MAYTKQTWHDLPVVDTPITAARLGHIEDGLEAAANTADSANTAAAAEPAARDTAITSAITALGLGSASTHAHSTYELNGAATTALATAESYTDAAISAEVTNRNSAISTAIAGVAAPDAAVVPYDATTSAGFQEENNLVEGMPVLQNVAATDVREAIDYLNRFVYKSGHDWYLLGQRDSLRRVYPLVGSAPTTSTGEQIPGIAPLGSSRTVPVANLATGTPDGTKFLRDDGTWVTPSAAAARTWGYDPADNNIRAANLDPAYLGITNPSLVASTCYAMKIFLKATTYTNYVVSVQTAGATLNANLYAFSLHNCDATGTLVTGSGTADAASVWTTAGSRTIALGTPFVNSTPGYFYILVQMGTGTTQPKVAAGGAHATANTGLAQSTNVAPNAATAPRMGNPTNSFTGLTPPATTGNIIDGANTLTFFVGLS